MQDVVHVQAVKTQSAGTGTADLDIDTVVFRPLMRVKSMNFYLDRNKERFIRVMSKL